MKVFDWFFDWTVSAARRRGRDGPLWLLRWMRAFLILAFVSLFWCGWNNILQYVAHDWSPVYAPGLLFSGLLWSRLPEIALDIAEADSLMPAARRKSCR